MSNVIPRGNGSVQPAVAGSQAVRPTEGAPKTEPVSDGSLQVKRPSVPIDRGVLGNAAERDRSLVFEGVDFFTRLKFSAQHGGSAFNAVLLAMGRTPESLSAAVRQTLDEHMDREFKKAANRGICPIHPAIATEMLIKGLRVLTS